MRLIESEHTQLLEHSQSLKINPSATFIKLHLRVQIYFALFEDFRNLDSLDTALVKRKINPLTSQSSQQQKQFPIVNQITAGY